MFVRERCVRDRLTDKSRRSRFVIENRVGDRAERYKRVMFVRESHVHERGESHVHERGESRVCEQKLCV